MHQEKKTRNELARDLHYNCKQDIKERKFSQYIIPTNKREFFLLVEQKYKTKKHWIKHACKIDLAMKPLEIFNITLNCAQKNPISAGIYLS